MFNLPSNVNIEVNSTSVKITFDKEAEVYVTQLDAYWIDGQGTYDMQTQGNSFNIDGLSLGTEYKFKLRVLSQDGNMLESEEYTFTTPERIIPTAPSNINVVIDETVKNNVTITFEKGDGVKTEIDAYWIDGQGTWDRYTTDEGFVFTNLQWGTVHKFKLRSVSNDGVTFAESEEVTFEIEPNVIEIPPTPPTNINVDVEISAFDNQPINRVAITFEKGEGLYTEIYAYFDGTGAWSGRTQGNLIVFDNLPFGAEYKFKLRTIAYNEVDTAESDDVTFTVDPVLIPTVPTNIEVQALSEFKVNNIDIAFTKGYGDTTEILKSWGDQVNTWTEITEKTDLSFEDLEFGKTYYFKLRSVTSLGLVAESETISFTIPEEIHPTVPRNISFEIDKTLLNTVYVKFTKGIGLCTEIDLNGEDKWEQSTTDEGFILEELFFGETYTFRLRSVGNNGEAAISNEFTFKIKEIEEVKEPTHIEVNRDRFHVIISFKKAKKALRTEICKLWEDDEDEFSDSTDGTEFDLGELDHGETYQFKLRSVGEPLRDKYGNQSDNYAETEIIEFEVPPYVEPVLLMDSISVEVEQYNAYIKFTSPDGLKMGIKKLWWHDGINDEQEKRVESNSWKYDNPEYDSEASNDIPADREEEEEETIESRYDEITTDNGFACLRLLDGEHKFILAAINEYGDYVESGEMSFVIEQGYVFVLTPPTPPTGISFIPESDSCVIKFKKGNGIKTEIDKIWEEEAGTWSEYTTGNSFYIEGLEPENTYYFKLRSVNTLGETAETEVLSFTTLPDSGAGEYVDYEEWITDAPTPPTNISYEIEGNGCTINFEKGIASRTEINKLWMESEGQWNEYTLGNSFYYDGLTIGQTYSFKLRSKNSLGETAETEVLSFTMVQSGEEGMLDADGNRVTDAPTPPTDINMIAEGTCFTVKFKPGVGCRTEIDRHWLEEEGTYGEYTTSNGFYFDGLQPGTTYTFKLRSVNSLGDTAETEELSVRTLKDGGGDGYYVDVEGNIPDGYYSNYEEKWFFTPNAENKPIGVTGDIKEKFEKLNAYYCGNPNVKAVYLTFDEGYEIGNTDKILDTLKMEGVKGTFFITKKYLDENPEIVKRMVREGHSVGNHSCSHPAMANVNRYKGFEGVKEELIGLETEFKNITGANMLHFFRPPMGKYSEECLVNVKKLGYKTMFWSFAYADYNVANQKAPSFVLDYATSCAFNGCIYLLHAVSTTNAEILGDLIKYLKENEYAIKDLRSMEYDNLM